MLAISASPASARVTSAHLTFERSTGAELCPSPEAVRTAVARRLDRDPFSDDGTTGIRCTVSRDAAGLHARISITDDPGDPPTERILFSPRTDCRELADAIELVLSIAIDPRVALTPPVSATAVAEAAPTGSGDSSAAPPPAVPTRIIPAPAMVQNDGGQVSRPARSWEVLLGIQALGAAGQGPAPAPGAGVGVGMRRGSWSLELDGRVVASSSVDVPGGTVSAWLGTLSVAPCWHLGGMVACAVGATGALRGRGAGFALGDSTTLPILSTGVRVGWETSLGQRWWMRASAELNVAVVRAHLLVDGNEAWATPRVNSVLVFSGGRRFR